jgi:hypothetical protein
MSAFDTGRTSSSQACCGARRHQVASHDLPLQSGIYTNETRIGYKPTERQIGELSYWNRLRATVGVYRCV